MCERTRVHVFAFSMRKLGIHSHWCNRENPMRSQVDTNNNDYQAIFFHKSLHCIARWRLKMWGSSWLRLCMCNIPERTNRYEWIFIAQFICTFFLSSIVRQFSLGHFVSVSAPLSTCQTTTAAAAPAPAVGIQNALIIIIIIISA